MQSNQIFLKDLPLSGKRSQVAGDFLTLNGQEYYKISNYDQMRPFFISLVSHSDHWMFISTTGGVSAGRKNSESALFPYYTDDKIEDFAEFTGSKSILRIKKGSKWILWEPFSTRFDSAYRVERNLYKNKSGNEIIFEEVNLDLKLTFQYSWSFSEKFGFVKGSKLINHSENPTLVQFLDGIQNILPFGANSSMQSATSNLVNAYKKNELDEASGLGMFMLSAIIVDKAEPSEALKTTTVWSIGVDKEQVLLCSNQLDTFRKGESITNEADIRAERGAYFVSATISLDPGENRDWKIVAEVNQDHADVFEIIERLKNQKDLTEVLQQDLETTTVSLLKLVGKSDGLQLTNDKLSVGRHYANVLFNIMRGGIFDEDYKVEKADLLDYVRVINKKVFVSQRAFFDQLGDELNYTELVAAAYESGHNDLIRICFEYLPLTFSRRHGDPSRPWNRFSIDLRDQEGKKVRRYEGNWRDIFQNWEALGVAFPGYILSMITKFVNASTIDGYNPYRITRNGIDWEVIEPDDPWSYIGYWGDHQIIYLQKLLEIAFAHDGAKLKSLLGQSHFVYANVPYRIKPYKAIVANPKDTIDYDHDVEEVVSKRLATVGADGKMVFLGEGLLKSNLTEKLLVAFLAKLTNYVPGGGIWLNTQRPEWNDANNALVGNGVSMVTLYYLRRFTSFMMKLFDGMSESLPINDVVYELFSGVKDEFHSKEPMLEGTISDQDRRRMVDALGLLGEAYRTKAYAGFSGQKKDLKVDDLMVFLEIVLKHIDHTINTNRRSDGLYHAYNLISFEGEKAQIDHLYEMLEGQVAVLSSGTLSLNESLEVLDALKSSKIYREDQYSYMLYPNRELPRFLDKNTIPADFIESSRLAKVLLAEGDRSLIYQDVNGNCHFNGTFNNASSVKEALDQLKETKGAMVAEEYERYLEVFESMFNHKAFTGRSGTFYGYEGLGSIYWHMVSKLLLAVQENIYSGWEEHKGTVLMGRMIDHYYEIRAGIGINKSPELYGSFPTDPYSHTPGNKGVQQPGMTGQVKEDVLNRWAELGVSVRNSSVHFEPIFLNESEYLTDASTFECFDLEENRKIIELTAGQLAFTYCQVPIVYQKGEKQTLDVELVGGTSAKEEGLSLSEELSRELFNRSGKVKKIVVTVPNT